MTDQTSNSWWTRIVNTYSHYSVTIILVTLIVTLPFSGKAFNIDDSLFVAHGRYLAENPLQPFDFSFVHNNVNYERFDRMTHSPFIGYCYAILFSVLPDAGEHEVHLVQIAFFFLFLLSFNRLAALFLKQTEGIIILTSICPALVLTFQTAMADGPALALGTAGLAVLIPARPGGHISLIRIISGGLFLTAAWLTAYQMLILSLLNIQLQRLIQPFGRRVPWASLISFSLFLLFQTATWYLWDSPQVIQAFQSSLIGTMSRFDIIVSFFAQLGGTCLMPLVILAVFFVYNPSTIIVFAVISVVIASLWYLQHGGGLLFLGQLAILTASGMLLMIIVFRNLLSSHRRFKPGPHFTSYSLFESSGHDFFWLLWLISFTVFAVGLTSFSAVRYIIYLVPAIMIVGGQSWARRSLGGTAKRTIAVLLFVATFSLTLMMSLVDFHFAESYRTFFQSPLMDQLGQSNHRIYTIGKFGLEQYGREAGFPSYVKDRTILRPGDILLEARYCGAPQNTIVSSWEQSRIYEVISIPITFPFPLRLVHEDGAGFYCSMVGPLPYIISRAPLEVITISIMGDDS